MPKLQSSAPTSARSRQLRVVVSHLTIGAAFGLTLGACGGEGGPTGTGGAFGSGGAVGSGGAFSSGGATASGGSATTGGTFGSGGAVGTGGLTSTGGATSSGGAASTGGATFTGGAASTGGAGQTGGAPGSGGGGSGTCEGGPTQGSEVLFIGESFVAASSIPEETTNLARAAGMLAQNQSYADKSESGTWIGPGGPGTPIPQQYTDNADGVRFVLMDGGGNDCWQGGQESHRNAALDAAENLFADMAANGVEKVVYFFYPDPVGSNWGSLTACLDLLRPAMQALCESSVAPECYWVDLRETWDGHPEYPAQDGIHVGGAGNVPTATAIFESMQENCVAP